MYTLPRLLCAVLPLLVYCQAAWAEPAADLRTKLKPGQELRYVFSSTNEDKTSVVGKDSAPVVQRGTMDMDLLVRVKEQTESGWIAELVFEGIRSTATTSKGQVQFDSKAPVETDASNPLASSLRPIVGTVLTLNLDKDGAISTVKGGEESSALKTPAGRMAAQQFDPAAIRTRYWSIFRTFNHAQAVPVGETWNSTQIGTIIPGNQVEVTRRHTLTALDASTATIDLVGDAKFVGDLPSKLESREIKGSSFVGTTRWDTQAGVLIEQNLSQGVTLELKNSEFHVMMDSIREVTLKRKD